MGASWCVQGKCCTLDFRESSSYLRKEHEGLLLIHLQLPILQHHAQDIRGIEGQPPHRVGSVPGEVSCLQDGWLSGV